MADLAELNSLASSLAEITARITAMADTAHRDGDEELALELFAVERSLSAALRRLTRGGPIRP